ncbi:hypothetical protein [Streptomyces cavernae]|uniref:hypothetical protein n=1 Tax=Streptomyces cavernae TaxID=2259034 RepID=UPI000FEB7CF1|nr:hypothetical protein [Streptomyces cavernae]
MSVSPRHPGAHARSSRRKRTIVTVLGAALALTGGALVVPGAMAALVPAPESTPFQLKGAESFDTDALMGKLCPGPTSQTPFRDVGFFFMSDNGELSVDPAKGAGDLGKIENGLVHRFDGHCEYPSIEVKESNGKPVKVTEDIPNCGDVVQTRESVSHTISTSSSITHSVSVGASFDFKIIKDVFGIGGSAEVTTAWSFGEEVSKTRTRDITVPPQTVGFLERVPKLRTVVSQPNFVIERWQTSTPEKVEEKDGWKGNGSIRVTSSGYTISATADALDADGFPSGVIRADDRPVTEADCS